MQREEWRSIKGFEGLYEVSNHGQVVTLHGRAGIARRLLALNIHQDGYAFVALCKDGATSHRSVHRLVLDAFRPGAGEINHKNGIKADNRIENLEWSTRDENMRHRLRTGLHPMKIGPKQLVALREQYAAGTSQKELAEIFGVTQSHVSRIIRHKRRAA